MKQPLAIVVVNYRSSSLLASNLVVSAGDVGPEHVVVVDNFSDIAERARLLELSAANGWHVVESPDNSGFGAGMNAGVARALELGARDLLLLNPDARISAEAVAALQSAAANKRGTVFAPRILDGAGKPWFDGADVYLADGLTRSRRHRDERPDEERWEWLSGACLLIPDEAWLRSGGFDPEYFLYWEDVDFSRRVVERGGSLEVVDGAVAVHDEGGTQDASGPGRAKSSGYYYYNIRNRLLFASKHLDDAGIRRWRGGAMRSAREILLRGGRRQFLRPWGPLKAAVRGVRDGRRIARDRLRAMSEDTA